MNRIGAATFLLFFCCSCFGASLHPPDLEAGDSYRWLFVTSQKRDALSTDIGVYNDFVQSIADDSALVGPLGLEWRAWGSTETVDARDNTHTNPDVDEAVPVYFLNGELFAASPSRMYTSDFLTPVIEPVDIDENGIRLTGITDRKVFTGTQPSGLVESRAPLGGRSTVIGDTRIGEGDVLSHSSMSSQETARFYAISELVTVPEPSGKAMLFLSAILLFTRQRRKHVSRQSL